MKKDTSEGNEKLRRIWNESGDLILITLLVVVDVAVTVSVMEYALDDTVYQGIVSIAKPNIDVNTFKNLLVLKSIILYMIAIQFIKKLQDTES